MAEAGLFGGSEGSRKMVTGGLWPEERREDRRCNIELPTSIKSAGRCSGVVFGRKSRGNIEGATSNFQLPLSRLDTGRGSRRAEVPDGDIEHRTANFQHSASNFQAVTDSAGSSLRVVDRFRTGRREGSRG